MRFAVLASGAGSNLQALLERVHGRGTAELVAVASDRPESRALQRAREAGIPVAAFPAGAFADRQERDAAMASWLEEQRVELVVLAGYMALLGETFLGRFPERVINVHPALLPAFPGLRAVEQALAYGVKVTGVTVHFVDGGVDTGPVILQRAVELPEGCTAEAATRLVHEVEHELLPEAVRLLAEARVRIDAENPRVVHLAR